MLNDTMLALHSPHATTLRFSSDVNMPAVRWLVDEIEYARCYLRHPRVTVEIDSHGGDSHSLEFWLQCCQRWKRDGFTVATRAVGAAESAAALMLSHGSIGARSALPTARLLFHTGRLITEGREVWTTQRLAVQRDRVDQFDTLMLDRLVTHILGARGEGARVDESSLARDDRPQLLARYHELWQRDTHITPAEALALGLLDHVEDY